MEKQELTEKMSSLLVMNELTIQIYDTAMSKVQDGEMQLQLEKFRSEHEHHVQQIKDWFQESGEKPVKPSKEFQNFMRVHLASITAAQGEAEALKAMHLSEAADNAEYGEAAKMKAPEQVTKMLKSHLRMEHKHLQAVEQKSPLMQLA